MNLNQSVFMQCCVLINFVGHGSESSAMDSYSRQKCIEVGTGNKNLCWIFVCKFLVPGRIWIRNSKIIKLDTDPNYWDSDPHHWRWASRSSAVFQYHNSRTRGMGSEDPCSRHWQSQIMCTGTSRSVNQIARLIYRKIIHFKNCEKQFVPPRRQILKVDPRTV